MAALKSPQASLEFASRRWATDMKAQGLNAPQGFMRRTARLIGPGYWGASSVLLRLTKPQSTAGNTNELGPSGDIGGSVAPRLVCEARHRLVKCTLVREHVQFMHSRVTLPALDGTNHDGPTQKYAANAMLTSGRGPPRGSRQNPTAALQCHGDGLLQRPVRDDVQRVSDR
jgi:hypothetical protein